MKASTSDRLDLEEGSYRKSGANAFVAGFDFSLVAQQALPVLLSSYTFDSINQTHNPDGTVYIEMLYQDATEIYLNLTPASNGFTLEATPVTRITLPNGSALTTEDGLTLDLGL